MRYTKEKQQSHKAWWGGALVLGVLSALVIFQLHQATFEAYTISSLEAAMEQHKEENKNLKLAQSAGNSFDQLASLAQQYNFEKVKNISYLQLLEGPVARKSGNNE